MKPEKKRKKSTNLTLNETIKSMAKEVMDASAFDTLTALVEQLIRDSHERKFGFRCNTPQVEPNRGDVNSSPGLAIGKGMMTAGVAAAQSLKAETEVPRKKKESRTVRRSKAAPRQKAGQVDAS